MAENEELQETGSEGEARQKILVADDEASIRRILETRLKMVGYDVVTAEDGEEAVEVFNKTNPDLVVLDVMMPKLDGYGLLKELRSRGMDTPVLFLTSKDAIEDRVKGLDMGADDYMIKPFDFDELLARIRVMTRKRTGNRSNVFTLRDLTVDTGRRTVSRGGTEISLLPKEFTILEYMIKNQGIVLSREQIENQIWNYEYSGTSNNVDVYISRLRKKIDSEHTVKLLHTIRGVGWVLRAEDI